MSDRTIRRTTPMMDTAQQRLTFTNGPGTVPYVSIPWQWFSHILRPNKRGQIQLANVVACLMLADMVYHYIPYHPVWDEKLGCYVVNPKFRIHPDENGHYFDEDNLLFRDRRWYAIRLHQSMDIIGVAWQQLEEMNLIECETAYRSEFGGTGRYIRLNIPEIERITYTQGALHPLDPYGVAQRQHERMLNRGSSRQSTPDSGPQGKTPPASGPSAAARPVESPSVEAALETPSAPCFGPWELLASMAGGVFAQANAGGTEPVSEEEDEEPEPTPPAVEEPEGGREIADPVKGPAPLQYHQQVRTERPQPPQLPKIELPSGCSDPQELARMQRNIEKTLRKHAAERKRKERVQRRREREERKAAEAAEKREWIKQSLILEQTWLEHYHRERKLRGKPKFDEHFAAVRIMWRRKFIHMLKPVEKGGLGLSVDQIQRYLYHVLIQKRFPYEHEELIYPSNLFLWAVKKLEAGESIRTWGAKDRSEQGEIPTMDDFMTSYRDSMDQSPSVQYSETLDDLLGFE